MSDSFKAQQDIRPFMSEQKLVLPGPPDINELERITLRCPECSKERRIKRLTIDPFRAAVIKFACPHCNSGDFREPQYFDADGKWVSWQEGQGRWTA